MLFTLEKNEITIKEMENKMKEKGYEIEEIGMQVVGHIDLSTDLDFYNYIIFNNKRKRIRIDFDVLVYDFKDLFNWVVKITEVETLKEGAR